jgi:thymidylate kinase
MATKFVVLTGLDGAGTTTIAEALGQLDPSANVIKTPGEAFLASRPEVDSRVRELSPWSHLLYYLSSVVYASDQIEGLLKLGNVYCVRYLIDTVVSHRVMGLDIELDYQLGGRQIRKPDLTVQIIVNEAVRQARLDKRGRSNLDKTLDDPETRQSFEREFGRLRDQFEVVDNTRATPGQVAQAIMIMMRST